MTSIATNANNDIFVDSSGNLAMVTGLAGVEQDCEHAMKTQLGEVVLNLQQGVPTDATIWSIYKPLQFEAAARATLLAVQNVLAVTAFSIDRINGVAVYTADIETAFGATAIQGTVGV